MTYRDFTKNSGCRETIRGRHHGIITPKRKQTAFHRNPAEQTLFPGKAICSGYIAAAGN